MKIKEITQTIRKNKLLLAIPIIIIGALFILQYNLKGTTVYVPENYIGSAEAETFAVYVVESPLQVVIATTDGSNLISTWANIRIGNAPFYDMFSDCNIGGCTPDRWSELYDSSKKAYIREITDEQLAKARELAEVEEGELTYTLTVHGRTFKRTDTGYEDKNAIVTVDFTLKPVLFGLPIPGFEISTILIGIAVLWRKKHG